MKVHIAFLSVFIGVHRRPIFATPAAVSNRASCAAPLGSAKRMKVHIAFFIRVHRSSSEFIGGQYLRPRLRLPIARHAPRRRGVRETNEGTHRIFYPCSSEFIGGQYLRPWLRLPIARHALRRRGFAKRMKVHIAFLSVFIGVHRRPIFTTPAAVSNRASCAAPPGVGETNEGTHRIFIRVHGSSSAANIYDPGFGFQSRVMRCAADSCELFNFFATQSRWSAQF